jgi:hypothetical protein
MKGHIVLLAVLWAAVSCSTPFNAEKPQHAAASQASAEPFKPKPAPQAITVGAFQLALQGCQLQYKGAGKSGSFTFEFPAPCQFSKDNRGHIRIVNTDNGPTLAIEASKPDEHGIAPGKDCNTNIRGVLITDSEVRLSMHTQTIAQCLPAVWDALMFHAFAAHTVSVSEAH